MRYTVPRLHLGEAQTDILAALREHGTKDVRWLCGYLGRTCLHQAMQILRERKLVRRVSRGKLGRTGATYRITERGLQELAKRIARGVVPGVATERRAR